MSNLAMQMMLASCARVKPQADFNLDGMEGKWYLAGFGSNEQWLKDRRGNIKTYSVIIKIPRSRDMHMYYSYLNSDGTCWRTIHVGKKTGTPGRFTFHSDFWNNDNDIRVVNVVHNNYAIIHSIIKKDGEVQYLNALYTRRAELTAGQREKFKEYCQTTGVPAENIEFLPPNGECREP